MQPMPHLIHRPRCLLCAGELAPLSAFSKVQLDGLADGLTVCYGVCENCQFAMATTVPSDGLLEQYYKANGQLRRERTTAAEAFHIQKQIGFLLPYFRCAGKRHLEIGPDMGHFLQLLHQHLPQQEFVFSELNVQARQHLEGLGYVAWDGLPVDTITLRHVFEHVASPIDFLQSMRSTLAPHGIVFIEVPDYSLLDPAVCDPFQFEHLSYFSLKSFSIIAEKTGFDIEAMQMDRTPGYSTTTGRVIRLILRRLPDQPQQKRWDALAGSSFSRFSGVVEKIRELHRQGLRVGVYGAGTFSRQLSSLHDLVGLVSVVYDADPKKQGEVMFGLNVTPAEAVAADSCDVLVLTVFGYEAEVRAFVRSKGFDPGRLISTAELH